jgi:hypothetical protein
MNEKLSDWASIAEIVSGIAVVITIVFLVVGIRENTNATQAVAFADLQAEFNRLNESQLDDPALAHLWVNRFDARVTDKLNAEEFSRLVLMNRMIFRLFESAYYARKKGSLDDAQWNRFLFAMCGNFRDQSEAVWKDTSFILSDEFNSFLADCFDERQATEVGRQPTLPAQSRASAEDWFGTVIQARGIVGLRPDIVVTVSET